MSQSNSDLECSYSRRYKRERCFNTNFAPVSEPNFNIAVEVETDKGIILVTSESYPVKNKIPRTMGISSLTISTLDWTSGLEELCKQFALLAISRKATHVVAVEIVIRLKENGLELIGLGVPVSYSQRDNGGGWDWLNEIRE